jgi:hypothetical protein
LLPSLLFLDFCPIPDGLDDPARLGKKEIADTSDPSWPPSLQQSWPYFIMGVSVMYLDLAQQELDQGRQGSMSIRRRMID